MSAFMLTSWYPTTTCFVASLALVDEHDTSQAGKPDKYKLPLEVIMLIYMTSHSWTGCNHTLISMLFVHLLASMVLVFAPLCPRSHLQCVMVRRLWILWFSQMVPLLRLSTLNTR